MTQEKQRSGSEVKDRKLDQTPYDDVWEDELELTVE